jgi:hypothetical protein
MYKVLGCRKLLWQRHTARSSVSGSQSKSPSKNLSLQKTSFSKSFVSSGKQEGGATVLWEET